MIADQFVGALSDPDDPCTMNSAHGMMKWSSILFRSSSLIEELLWIRS